MMITNPLYQGMNVAFQEYRVDDTSFTDALREDIFSHTGLEQSGWAGDWWVHPAGNPIFSWSELCRLALSILHCEATRLFVPNLYMATHVPSVTLQEGAQLTVFHVSGAKRVNAYSGDYTDYTDFVGMAAIRKALRGEKNRPEEAPRIQNSLDRFRLSGKDESCVVEGTWFDWVCFACNILASKNTQALCPNLYEPALANDNY